MNWTLVETRLPPPNVRIDTLSEGGQQQELVFYRNLWWFPSMSMYVYYTPKYWRTIEEDHV